MGEIPMWPRAGALALAVAALHLGGLGCRPVAPVPTSPQPVESQAAVTAAEDRATAGQRAAHAKITMLSTMLADRGIGEWGFSALVEVDGVRILFDAGLRQDTVAINAKALDIDLSTVDIVVLSHHHNDHVGGLMTLRNAAQQQRPEALATLHVARGMFESRHGRQGDREINRMLAIREAYEAGGARVVVHDRPGEIAPGVWVTGPVPRVHPEHNWSPGRRIGRDGQWREDDLPESQSLVIHTAKGLVVLSGCGHAGMINTLDYAQTLVPGTPVHAVVGGFHLLDANEEHLRWTASQLERAGVKQVFAAHCTGLEPVYRFREWLDLPRKDSIVAAVGASFDTRAGIDPRSVAR